jgi:hypothetical protein
MIQMKRENKTPYNNVYVQLFTNKIMREIKIKYRDLRQTIERITDLVSETTLCDRKKINLKTSINHDIGVQGDDWDDILIKLRDQENLTLEGLNFYDYFYDEGQLSSMAPLSLLLLPVRLVTYMLTFAWRQVGIKEYFFYDFGEKKPPLTIGDLVTSKIEGRFVRRQDRTFILDCAK